MDYNIGQLFASYKEKMPHQEFEDTFIFTIKGLKKWSTLDWLLSQNKQAQTSDKQLFAEVFERLMKKESPQYIIGEAEFCEMMLSVDQRVLIPRVETEELVELILKENPTARRSVLEIGTGSGAIALALKKARPDWNIVATDISSAALEVAKENAKHQQLAISFLTSDVFEEVIGKFDIIVSNPPYISYADKDEVAEDVLRSEPHLALFAEDDGYAIYQIIIGQAPDYLKDGGKLYFEIGYKQGTRVKEMIEKSFPKATVSVIQDQFGKDRMVSMSDEKMG